MSKRFFAVLTALLCVAADPSWSVMHLHPGTYPHAAQDQIHHPSESQIHAAGSMHAAIASDAVGDKNVAVILVQFLPSTTAGITSGNYLITNLNLAAIDNYYVQQKNYYSEVSYGLLKLHFTFFGVNGAQTTAAAAGVYTLQNPMEWYGCGDEGTGCDGGVHTPTSPIVSANGDYLIRDAIGKTDSSLNAGNYNAVIVMHAGNGNETTSSTPGDIWSIFYSQDPVITAAGRGFSEGDVVPATEGFSYSPLGVMCHEFGHSLGLPDLYNTTDIGGTPVVGDWELMDSGPYDGHGANPSHMGAWDKIQLGWVTPIVSTGTHTLDLAAVEKSPDVGKLPVVNGSPGEYFLVEYRFPSSGALFDQAIPGQGLLVWHIDDSIAQSRGINVLDPTLANTVNSGIPHYGVSIVPANQVPISNSNQGSAGNPFQNGQFFSSPLSDDFAGQATGINIVNIGGVGSPTTTSQAINLTVGSSQQILSLNNFPNPAGKKYQPYYHTTFQFQMTRPANDFSINIYSLSGNLVRKVSQGDIVLNANRCANNKWVYEYVWDLTNGDGSSVAPGVYFYTLDVDGDKARGKLVVIR